MSDTPRTDALSAKLYNESPQGSLTERAFVVLGELADFARQLEKELNEAKEALNVARNAMSECIDGRESWKQCAKELANVASDANRYYNENCPCAICMDTKAALTRFTKLKDQTK